MRRRNLSPGELPRWADYALLPAINLAVALLLSGLLVWGLGVDPLQALESLVGGAVGYPEAIGFTLYYATDFIFTGLAVAVAFHCGLFNIGGEGQAYVGGLGTALVCLWLGSWPLWAVLPIAILASAGFGAVWGVIPGYLQAKRGSHIVITTIMFNFLAAALMTYLLVDVLIEPGGQNPESVEFAPGVWLPFIHEVLADFGYDMGQSPLNLSFLLALACCLLVWLFVWHTRWGYEIRAVGHNEKAAHYAGISASRAIILAMAVSGGLAGLVGINDIMGVHHRLILGFSNGFGFVGIAVALMGRNHPIGIIAAALLFGALYQGGSELAFSMPGVTKEMILTIQAMVILFTGAMGDMLRLPLQSVFARLKPR